MVLGGLCALKVFNTHYKLFFKFKNLKFPSHASTFNTLAHKILSHIFNVCKHCTYNLKENYRLKCSAGHTHAATTIAERYAVEWRKVNFAIHGMYKVLGVVLTIAKMYEEEKGGDEKIKK